MRIKNETEETAVKLESTREQNQVNAEQPAVISMDFTEEELKMLRNGILSLIERTTQAKVLVPDERVHVAIDEYCTGLQALNAKVCRCM